MVPPLSEAGDWPVERVGGEVIAHPHGSCWAACTEFPNHLSALMVNIFHRETRNYLVTHCMHGTPVLLECTNGDHISKRN